MPAMPQRDLRMILLRFYNPLVKDCNLNFRNKEWKIQAIRDLPKVTKYQNQKVVDVTQLGLNLSLLFIKISQILLLCIFHTLKFS